MSYEAWGDDDGMEGYVTEERAKEMVQEAISELSDQVMRWFKAASPYATPGSLEQALRGHIVGAMHPINAPGGEPLTASEIDELRRNLLTAEPSYSQWHIDALCYMAKKALQPAQPAGDAPIDSTIKPSAWD